MRLEAEAPRVGVGFFVFCGVALELEILVVRLISPLPMTAVVFLIPHDVVTLKCTSIICFYAILVRVTSRFPCYLHSCISEVVKLVA